MSQNLLLEPNTQKKETLPLRSSTRHVSTRK